MIGYAPFLGQVRLVRLGQATLSDEEVKRETDQTTERISLFRQRIQTTNMRPGVRQAFVDKLNSCEMWLPEARTREEFDGINTCIDEVAEALASPLLPLLVTREEAEGRIFPPAAGIPTWAKVVGGLAAAGVVGWLVLRK